MTDSAMTSDASTDDASARDKDEKNAPTTPFKKPSGANTTTAVSVDEITGPARNDTPASAASPGPFPFASRSRRRQDRSATSRGGADRRVLRGPGLRPRAGSARGRLRPRSSTSGPRP